MPEMQVKPTVFMKTPSYRVLNAPLCIYTDLNTITH